MAAANCFTSLPFMFAENGCLTLLAGDQSFNDTLVYPSMTWFETPSIVPLSAGTMKYARDYCVVDVLPWGGMGGCYTEPHLNQLSC